MRKACRSVSRLCSLVWHHGEVEQCHVTFRLQSASEHTFTTVYKLLLPWSTVFITYTLKNKNLRHKDLCFHSFFWFFFPFQRSFSSASSALLESGRQSEGQSNPMFVRDNGFPSSASCRYTGSIKHPGEPPVKDAKKWPAPTSGPGKMLLCLQCFLGALISPLAVYLWM